jgi:peptide/nickel transport system substrate-binding protein
MWRIRRFLAIGALLAASGCQSPAKTSRESTGAAGSPGGSNVRRGGELALSIRAEPRTFNSLTVPDTTTEVLASLLHAKLIRINRTTDEIEPWLAESWTRSGDGLRYVIKLRPNVTFSDGQPLTSSDVVFSLAAAYSFRPVASALEVDGKRLTMDAVDPLTIDLTFPAVFAPGLRILDRLPVIPRHRLEAALKNGTIDKALNLSTPPSELVGLGPFVLSEYLPGQRLVFARNPRYWRRDAGGGPLPYLDRVILDIIPDTNTQLLRLESGQSDMMASEVPADAYATVKRAADAKSLQLHDLGVGPDANALWFNLKPGSLGHDPRAAWLQRDELRRAISMAVDRTLFADTVFLGAGVPVFGPITPANKRWYWAGTPQTPHDPAAAKKLLASIGLVDRNGDGVLDDASGKPAQFTLITQKGRPALERGVAVVRDELKKIGLVVDVAALDSGAVIQRIVTSKYDAVYFNPTWSDTDPAANADVWLSSGSGHFWNMEQKTPATGWERQIDELMVKQMHSIDEGERKRLFDEVQKIFAEHVPVIYFVAPRIFAAASTRVQNVTPAVNAPQLFWSPDTVAVAR